jgi:myo-inositol-1(or 4)-monophosphatase
VEFERITEVALAAAARGGDILRQHWGKQHSVQKKGSIDLVTEADIASEKAMVEIIRSSFPEHGIQAEEGGMEAGKASQTWIIDPLDGTTNYAHGLPEFSLSIALSTGGRPVFGLVLSPIMGELFCAVEGKGATLNGKSIHVSNVQKLKESLLVTGFPYELESIATPVMHRLQQCLLASQGIRRLGSAALDLCYVACGRFEGFWEQNLAPWDTAAGIVIAREAGASVTDFADKPYDINKKEILATNGFIHQQLITLLRN